jgi:phosphatidylserine decarboxylase
MANRQPAVEKLVGLLDANATLREALTSSLKEAAEPGLMDLGEFYDYLDRILTHIPVENELMPSVRKFYYVISKSPDDVLKTDRSFNEWINEFIASRGNFLDTPASTETLDSFIHCGDYHIDDYIGGPSGWLSFNQFLARQLKPGKRPIAGLCDDSLVVSPADSTYKGQWVVSDDSRIEVKGYWYKITDLLSGSKFRESFRGGLFTHSFLTIHDYHRFHVPVSGVVREVRHIPAGTWLNESRKPDGSIENVDDVGFQFEHTRGMIVIESAVGLVAVMPVGMGHISSVVLTVEEGTRLVKGEEFGYFAFGGSDMILLFEKDGVSLTAEKEVFYPMGTPIGHAVKPK